MKNKKLRAAARGKDCTFNIAGICHNNTETTSLNHLPDESHGMAKKSDDISSAIGCHDCHDVVDGRVKCIRGNYVDCDCALCRYKESAEFYMRRAMVRTWRIWITEGLVRLP